MRNVAPLILAFAVTACSATLPPQLTEGDAPIARGFLENRVVTFCEANQSERLCIPNSRGLSANGLGGLLLPLSAELEIIQIASDTAEISLDVNDIPATCSRGNVDWDADPSGVKIDGIFCNWLAIGNVAATLTLTIDWTEGSERFGGRYAITFGGTGNGSGSGYFIASGATS